MYHVCVVNATTRRRRIYTNILYTTQLCVVRGWRGTVGTYVVGSKQFSRTQNRHRIYASNFTCQTTENPIRNYVYSTGTHTHTHLHHVMFIVEHNNAIYHAVRRGELREHARARRTPRGDLSIFSYKYILYKYMYIECCEVDHPPTLYIVYALSRNKIHFPICTRVAASGVGVYISQNTVSPHQRSHSY